MSAYILRRLLLIIPTLFGISLVCFTLVQFVPGGPVEQMIAKIQAGAAYHPGSRGVSAEEVENIKNYFGFDKPAHVRYFTWLGNMLRGDFGNSYAYQKPVLEVILDKVPISIFFGLVSYIIAYAISIPLGMRKAMSHGGWLDTASSVLIFAGYVIPGYALGILLIIFFAGGSYFDWFPIGNIVSDNFESLSPVGKVLDFLHHMVLPVFCYIIGDFALLTLLMKNSVIEELNKDYMRTAMAKGLSSVAPHGGTPSAMRSSPSPPVSAPSSPCSSPPPCSSSASSTSMAWACFSSTPWSAATTTSCLASSCSAACS
jgi:microcin C transport system permease protein